MAEPRTGRETRFTKEFGSFYFYRGGQISYMADELALAFDDDSEAPTLLKHGPAERVHVWAKEARRKYREFGFDDQADHLTVVSSSEWDLEELTRIINGAGTAVFLRRLTEQASG